MESRAGRRAVQVAIGLLGRGEQSPISPPSDESSHNFLKISCVYAVQRRQFVKRSQPPATNTATVNFVQLLHLVAAISLATIVSKYFEAVCDLPTSVEVLSMSTTFSARLNRLFDTVYPPGRGPHTSAEVIAALKAEGVTMSAPYLSQLRSGNRTNPSAATMAALANFFRIKPAYFTDDEYYEKLDKELTWLANMRDEGVRRIAARTVGLSAEAQQDIALKVDELRRREHLDD